MIYWPKLRTASESERVFGLLHQLGGVLELFDCAPPPRCEDRIDADWLTAWFDLRFEARAFGEFVQLKPVRYAETCLLRKGYVSTARLRCNSIAAEIVAGGTCGTWHNAGRAHNHFVLLNAATVEVNPSGGGANVLHDISLKLPWVSLGDFVRRYPNESIDAG